MTRCLLWFSIIREGKLDQHITRYFEGIPPRVGESVFLDLEPSEEFKVVSVYNIYRLGTENGTHQTIVVEMVPSPGVHRNLGRYYAIHGEIYEPEPPSPELPTSPILSSLNLAGHRCRKILEIPNYQLTRREQGAEAWWWMGELLEPIPGHEVETHCIHIKTPLKPEIVFCGNASDMGPYAVIAQVFNRSRSINPNWTNRMEEMYRKAAE